MSTRKQNKHNRKPRTAREEPRYPFPIPSREAILKIMNATGKPMSLEAIARELGVTEKNEIEAFSRRLRAMERDGQILRNRRGLYGLIEKMDMICGRVIAHPDGYGFLAPDAGGDDMFLPAKAMRRVLHGDRVVARVSGRDARGRQEVAVIDILERGNKTVVGRYLYENHMGSIMPEDKRLTQDIYIPAGNDGGALHGQIVVAEITEQPTHRAQPVGRVIEVLGEHMAPGMEIAVAIRKHGIPHVWPGEVEQDTQALSAEVDERGKQGRKDLRHLPLVTIDGEDARDFDDAVYCERHDKEWRLLIAIADVSHYVNPGSALDREAYERGNSVYFPQQVIPMLPEILSNGLCSLNPEVDRLCMVCDMEISGQGIIKRYRFYEAVMRSYARLTYTKVAAVLVERNAELAKQYAELLPHLENLHGLYKLLHEVRMHRGAVDLELPETRIIFDKDRKIERIVPLERNEAHRLIEECMLAANVCAAECLKKHKVPAPYRVHGGPTPEKLNDLREFLGELGLSLGGGNNPQARDYSRLISSVSARKDTRLIQMVLLRSLSQAVYSPDNIGHFALGYENYTHFTSPIRRYPDLMVHRAIKRILAKEPPELTQELAVARGQHCSITERRADEATRDVVRWLKAEFMRDKVGEEFDGIISGVTSFGVFVELDEIFVDGLVHITAMGNDYYHFDAAKHRLTGDRTRRTFRLGDKLRVRLVRVDLDEAQLDFELTGPALKGGGSGLRRKSRAKSKAKKRRAD